MKMPKTSQEKHEPSKHRTKTADLNLKGQKIVSWPGRAGAKTNEELENSNR